ncbi:MAG: hypothetical protein Q4B17_11950 [Lautropia sp.]|nr:hypothetical protein [Lautropia sp.]
MLTTNRKTQISAAVLLLLAGCGGGGAGGSDRAVSSSPAAPGSTTINANINTGSTAVSGASSETTASGNATQGAGTTAGTNEAVNGSAADRSRAEAEARAREQAAAQARAKAEAEARDRALAEAQANARKEAEARARAAAAAEAEAKARAEERARAEAKAQAEAQAAAAEAARAKAEREARAAAEAAAKARAEEEARRLAEEQAAARAKAEAEEKARQEAAAKAQAEADTKARAEADARQAEEEKNKANTTAQVAGDNAAKAEAEAQEAGKAKADAEQQAIRDTELEGQINARPPTINEPINTAGISGNVLAAMLDQVVAGGMAGSPSAITQARPRPGAPDVVVNAPQAPDRDYMNAAPAPGAYTEAKAAYQYRTTTMSGGGTTGFTTVHLSLQVSPSADALSLPATVNVATGTEQLGQGMTLNGGPITLPRNERQDFGHVVREWKNGESSVQLMLLTGDAPDDARMCWNYALPAVGVNRLQCNHWEVPENWKRGEPLRFKGVTITEKQDGIEQIWQSQP